MFSNAEGGMGSKNELTATATDALLKFDGLSQQDLERLVTGAYRVRGYDVRPIRSAGEDDEGHLLLSKEAQRILLQCKHWKTRKVGEMPVRELYGAMAGHAATGGILISSGTFTLEATRFAGFGGIELLDAARFKALLQRKPAEQDHAPSAQPMAG
jgi:restriction system protein